MSDQETYQYAYGRAPYQPEGADAKGQVMDRTNTCDKVDDPGMAARLGRGRATSDYERPTPEDHVVAPGQRTVTAPDSSLRPVKTY